MRFEPARAHADLPGWLVAVLSILLLVAVVAAMRWAQTLDVTRGVVGSPGMFPHRGPIESITEIARASNPENLVGRPVILDDVVIDRMLGEQVFVIDGVIGVLFEPPATRPEEIRLRAGQRVRIYGIARSLRDPSEIVELDELEPRHVAREARHAIYVAALHVVPLSLPDRIAEPPRVITSVAQLADFGPETLQARDVVFDRADVVEIIGEHTFVIGDGRTRVPVVLLGELTERQPETTREIRVGDVVGIYGFVRRMRGAAEIEDVETLSADEQARLRSATIYVSALRVAPREPSS